MYDQIEVREKRNDLRDILSIDGRIKNAIFEELLSSLSDYEIMNYSPEDIIVILLEMIERKQILKEYNDEKVHETVTALWDIKERIERPGPK